MVVKALLSAEEYLQTSFESPDPDYIDGVLVERAMPANTHSRVSKNIFKAFLPWDDAGTLIARWEIRLQVSPSRFRVADLAFFTAAPTSEIPTEQPYVVVEVVSPTDRNDELIGKLADYDRAGIPFIFVAEPPYRLLWQYRERSLISVPALAVPSHNVDIPLDTIFA